jgi:hypothetical protein
MTMNLLEEVLSDIGKNFRGGTTTMKVREITCDECKETCYLYTVYFDDSNDVIMCTTCLIDSGLIDQYVDELEDEDEI